MPTPFASTSTARGRTRLFEESQDNIERWNREWLNYLEKEWYTQLRPHSAYPETPPLPEDPLDLLDLNLGSGPPLGLYCRREDLKGRAVLEMGCGCGNLGKLLGRYVRSYYGTDFSPLALAVARLVSPANCSYFHVSQARNLPGLQGKIQTVVARHFWIHQNLQMGRESLEFLVPFVQTGGRIYADFFWPDRDRSQGVVLPASSNLSEEHPSATYQFTRGEIEGLRRLFPLELVHEEVCTAKQRRFVIWERRDG